MFKFIVLSMIFLMLPYDSRARTVILGFDGMDPKLVQQWMDSGDLPHFKDLALNGHFQSLATTNPAQSPVAWSSFATGLNPGKHGIFDFIHRDPEKLEPVYSISGFKQAETFDFLGWQVPMSKPFIYNKRLGKPFWLTAEQTGNNSSILRVPVTYPPDNVTSMLSGMGVPDLLGTQGTYTFYATKFINKGKAGGNIVRIKVKNDRIETKLHGPPNPFGGEVLSIPLMMNKIDHESLTVNINGETVELQQGDWSQWLAVKFSYGGIFSLNGMVRMHLVESFPRVKLYVSPININPQSPVLPIANPAEFAQQLSAEIGLYHTLGMPEETWSFNDGLIDSNTYLQMVKTVLAEREKMFFRQLDDENIELLVAVFVQTDRVSHMFWRGYDPQHPGFNETTALERNAIKWIYTEADRILGKTLTKLNKDDKLLVLSDHGFAPYYRHVNLNSWLLEHNYLTLLPTYENSAKSFSLQDVDWQKTKAYAMGLNGIYLNLKGREKYGIVNATDRLKISAEIRAALKQLKDPKKQQNVINHTYLNSEIYHGDENKNSPDLIIGYNRGYRASWQTILGEGNNEIFKTNTDKWSGDHCIDPVLVAGVLFTNFELKQQVTSISDIGKLALATLPKSKTLNQTDLKQSGLLDMPRAFFTSILTPLKLYVPHIIAELLTGMVFMLCLILILKFSSRVPTKYAFKLLIQTIIITATFIAFVDAAKELFSRSYVVDGEEILIQATAIDAVKLPQLHWFGKEKGKDKNTNTKSLAKNVWQYQPSAATITLTESDGYQLLSLSKNTQALSKVQKNWWHNILSNKGGYISPYSQVQELVIWSKRDNTLWWLWVVVGGLLLWLILNIKVKKAKG